MHVRRRLRACVRAGRSDHQGARLPLLLLSLLLPLLLLRRRPLLLLLLPLLLTTTTVTTTTSSYCFYYYHYYYYHYYYSYYEWTLQLWLSLQRYWLASWLFFFAAGSREQTALLVNPPAPQGQAHCLPAYLS